MMRAVSPCRGRLAVIFSNAFFEKGRYSKMAGLCLMLGCSARLARLDRGRTCQRYGLIVVQGQGDLHDGQPGCGLTVVDLVHGFLVCVS